MSKLFLILTTLFIQLSCLAQSVNYSHLSLESNELKKHFTNNNDYFSGGSSEYPYFQGKLSGSYIKFYRSTSTTCVIDLKSQQDYNSLIKEIQNNASFRYKYNTSYQEPVVYNYETSNGSKIRFDLTQMRISIEYPSAISSLMDQNFGITPVFVCLSEDAYAFHTNLRCEGLGNCQSKIAETNVREAKKNNFNICNLFNSSWTKLHLQRRQSV